MGGKVTIEFKVANDAEVGFFYASFTAQDDPSSKIIIKAQNEKNASSLPDHYDFSFGSNDIYTVNVPIIVEGNIFPYNALYELDSFSAADEKISIVSISESVVRGIYPSLEASNVGTESKYSENVTNTDNFDFFVSLNQTDIMLDIGLRTRDLDWVYEDEPNNQGSPNSIIYMPSLMRGEKATPEDTSPFNKKVMGLLEAGDEDWWRFQIEQDGLLVLQTIIDGSAKLELTNEYGNVDTFTGPKTVSKQVDNFEVIYLEVEEYETYYLKLGDADAPDTPYEFLLDIL